MESAGAKLKKIRQEKGISLEEAYKKTKIHLSILKAMEEDNIINLSPVYIKGFLKIYCKFLGVNPKDFISDYKEPESIPTIVRPVLDMEEKPVSFLKAASIKLVSFRPGVKLKTALKISLIFIVGAILLFNLGKFVSSKRSSPAKQAKLPVSLTKSSQKISASAVTSGIRLGIRAKEDCWVQIKLDGRLIFQNILKKGRFENWQAKDKIELSLGNAGVVNLEVNGKLISALGRKGQTLKNILITKEGLSIAR